MQIPIIILLLLMQTWLNIILLDHQLTLTHLCIIHSNITTLVRFITIITSQIIFLKQHQKPLKTWLSIKILSKDAQEITNIIQSIDLLSLLSNSAIKSQLIYFRSSFNNFTNFHFYIDGSLIHLGTVQINMSIGWIQILYSVSQHQFNARVVDWPSSTRAELFSFLTVLLVLPHHSSILIHRPLFKISTIYTILSYHYLLDDSLNLKTMISDFLSNI